MQRYLLATLALMPISIACGAPGMADGVFSHADFSLRSDDPLAQVGGSQRDMLVVMAETENETLRTVAVGLNRFLSLPRGTPAEAGTGEPGDLRPFVEVTVGALIVEERNDGVQLISSVDPVRATSVAGTVTLEELEPEVSGTFAVDLDDGGHLVGSFVAQRAE